MRLVTVVGARPQFIKAGAVSRTIEHWNAAHGETAFEEILVHTGQHYDTRLSDVFFDQLGLRPPKYQLAVGSGSHGAQTGEMLKRIESVLLKEAPDVVLVYGDTNSTIAGALAAAKLEIPVGHVEAGLRSFRRDMPEEINRVVTDHLASWRFCPSSSAVANLAREGITEGVYLVGDVMLDSLRSNRQRAREHSRILQELDLSPGAYVVATLHRAGNTANRARVGLFLRAFCRIVEAGERVVFPVHPRTRALIDAKHSLPPGLVLVDPVSYLDMLQLETNAKAILTDSGGVQKEAYWLGVPCVTLRHETEWTETVECGWNHLAGDDPEHILKTFFDIISNRHQRSAEPPALNCLSASEAILGVLAG